MPACLTGIRRSLRRERKRAKTRFFYVSGETPCCKGKRGKLMPNAQKEQTVSELRGIIAQSKGAILTDYRGLTVAEVTNLRKKLRAADAEYHIVKNTLFKLALGGEISPELE